MSHSFQNFSAVLGKVLAPSSVFCQCLRNGNRQLIIRKDLAFDCLSHDLLTVKLNAYGFSIDSLRLVQDYLENRKQRTKINSAYSSWEEILFGVSQGSILGPLLFNIFLCDLFFIMDDIDFTSYADENPPYTIGNNIEVLFSNLQNSSKILFQWVMDNQMKANPDKCHFVCSTNGTANLIC